jgi:molybdopterin molybdotransferase
MIPYSEARALVSTLPLRVRTESLPLLDAGGRILAEDVVAPWALPRFDNSSMDGFAVRSNDLAGACENAPVRLPVRGESAAGRPLHHPLAPGTAVRISTGARLPHDADGIVPVEQARVDGEAILVTAPVVPGRFIRRRGEDVAEGTRLFGPGTRLDAAPLAFLAMFNLPVLPVFVPPRVAILSSGDEVRLHGDPLGETDVVGVNVYYLERELRAFGCETRLMGIAPDDPAAFERLLDEALRWGDLVVSSAGVSVGEHDVVGRAVAALGGEVLFWGVSIRPGKPTLVARFDDRPLFAFPGNPVAVCCNTEVLLKPFLREKLAIMPADAPRLRVRLAVPCPRDAQRLFFVSARLEWRGGSPSATPLPHQSSGNLSNPANADALLVIEPGPEPVAAGQEVEALALHPGR